VFARLCGAEGEGAFSGAFDVHDAVVVIEGFLGLGLAGWVVGEKEGEDVHRPRYLLRVVGLLRTPQIVR
jgi:hypothetical protein